MNYSIPNIETHQLFQTLIRIAFLVFGSFGMKADHEDPTETVSGYERQAEIRGQRRDGVALRWQSETDALSAEPGPIPGQA